MAAVFTLIVAVVGIGLYTGVMRYVRWGRGGRWLLNPFLPLVIVCTILTTYLVVKIAYEEIYPCVAIDSMYCDFSSTQYHNLFGWEF